MKKIIRSLPALCFSQLYVKVLYIEYFQLDQMAQKYYLTLTISGCFRFEIGKVT